MRTYPRLLLSIVAFAAMTGSSFAQPDERFLRMWTVAQRARPASLTAVSRIAGEREPGTPLIVHGVILDGNGRPAAGVEVFAYHTDAGGTYAPPGATDPWRLKGWAVTDAQGRFEFRTIRPAPYPGRDIPAHIHATLTTRCCGRQFDDLMFDDDPLATRAYRDRFATAGEHGLYGAVTRIAGGTEEVSYTFRIREHGNF
jgi:protocatechuate 3,4-dioxygenase beta subunit